MVLKGLDTDQLHFRFTLHPGSGPNGLLLCQRLKKFVEGNSPWGLKGLPIASSTTSRV